jgi:hypothetical protein
MSKNQEIILRTEKCQRERLEWLKAQLALHSPLKALKDSAWLEERCGYTALTEEELIKMKEEIEVLEDMVCDHEILLLEGIDPVYFDYEDRTMSPVFLGRCLENGCYKVVKINSFVANAKTIIRPNDSRLYRKEMKMGLVLPGISVNTNLI